VFDIEVPKKTDRIVFLGRAFLANETRYPWELGVGVEYPIDCLAHLENLSAQGPAIAGISPFKNVYASVALKNTDGSFTFSAKTEYTVDMLEYNEISAEKVLLLENASIDELFNLYRPLLPVSKFPMPKLTGWNSWDYYLDKVNADDVMESIEREAALCGQKKSARGAEDAVDEDGAPEDPMLKNALELAVETGKISTSLIQRRLSLGYGRAAKLIDRMEVLGYVSAPEGQKPRQVLITKAQYNEMMLASDDIEE
jgi:hypothetical protein